MEEQASEVQTTSQVVKEIMEKGVQLQKELVEKNKETEQLNQEKKKAKKKRKRQEEEKELLPWQRTNPDLNSSLRHKIKKPKLELQEEQRKALEDLFVQLKQLLEENLKEEELKRMKILLDFDLTDDIIMKIKTRMLTSWRLGLLEFALKPILKLCGFNVSQFDPASWKEFLEKLDKACSIIDVY